jgi:tetratricopeptide (TPR) repeat protein
MQQDLIFQQLINALLSKENEKAEHNFSQLHQAPLLSQFAIWALENHFSDYGLRAFERFAQTSQEPEAYLDWTNALLFLCEYSQALVTAKRATELMPQEPMSWTLLALAHERLHDIDLALHNYQRALSLAPENPFIRYNHGCTLLLSGDFEKGWQEHEWRLFLSPEHQAYQPLPRWTGQNRQGTGILVYTEQGFGDTLQFCRFLDLIDQSQGPIYLACQAELQSLVKLNFPGIKVVGEGDELEVGYQVSLMSLPAIASLKESELSPKSPYLRPAEKKSQNQKGPQIGLVWSSGRHAGLGAYAHLGKSINLKQLLKNLPQAAQYFSFQTGPEASEINSELNSETELVIHDLSTKIKSFADTAIYLADMDLVLTVDTATAHLAGALGVDTRILVPFAPNWRWLLDRKTTPWYASMTLYRQQQPNDWTTALSELNHDLNKQLQHSKA